MTITKIAIVSLMTKKLKSYFSGSEVFNKYIQCPNSFTTCQWKCENLSCQLSFVETRHPA